MSYEITVHIVISEETVLATRICSCGLVSELVRFDCGDHIKFGIRHPDPWCKEAQEEVERLHSVAISAASIAETLHRLNGACDDEPEWTVNDIPAFELRLPPGYDDAPGSGPPEP